MLAAAQQSVSAAIEVRHPTSFGHQTYMLASATGSGARYAWHHAVSQTSPSNFHQHVRTWLIALASRNGAAHWRWLESFNDCVKSQYVSFPFSEPVERAEFHEIHPNVNSVVSKNLVE